jgi:hypothetical protein
MTANPASSSRLDRRPLLDGTAGLAAGPATPAAGSGGYVAQPTAYRTTVVDGHAIFYREAGDPAAAGEPRTGHARVR